MSWSGNLRNVLKSKIARKSCGVESWNFYDKKISKINPKTKIEIFKEFLNENNA